MRTHVRGPAIISLPAIASLRMFTIAYTQSWGERERDSSDDVADSDLIVACVHVHEHICACASAKRVAACAGLAWWTRMGRVQIGCSDKIAVADKAMLYFAHTLIPVKCLIEKSNTRALPSARNYSDQIAEQWQSVDAAPQRPNRQAMAERRCGTPATKSPSNGRA